MKSVILLVCSVMCAQAAEPIVGKWLMQSQEVAGKQTASRPLTLQITQTGDLLEFEYSVSQNLKKEISLRFAARLGGSEGEVKDSKGARIGSVKIMRQGDGYLVLLQGPNRPMSSGRLTLSRNGKTLTSEADATAPNGARAHTTQLFERQ
ncbi:MAG TPA: hypothetical protein VG456_19050 [Candidatus Sulfopaludibacter sp.]|jgi:hypothetical protein|nr:hypothetical protein [Candidatus Sulfopaludibacter sp.]